MHGPDGVDYPNHTVYFEALGNSLTRMTMTMRFKDAEEAKRSRQVIRDLGGNSTWDRLAEYLAQNESNTEVLVIQRSSDTRPEALFDCWRRWRLCRWRANHQLPGGGAPCECPR